MTNKKNYKYIYESRLKKVKSLIKKFSHNEKLCSKMAEKNEKYSCDQAIFRAQANAWGLAKDQLYLIFKKELEE